MTQDNIRDFAGNWTGTGSVSGAGDGETLCLDSGEYMDGEVVETGSKIVRLRQNVYAAGGTGYLYYRTGATVDDCTNENWVRYTDPFTSLGYCQARVQYDESYAEQLLAMFSGNLIGYWPLGEVSGVTAYDLGGSSFNGTYRNTGGVLNGVTLDQTGISGDTRHSTLFDGTNGYANVYSTGLRAVFPGTAGTLCAIAKFPDATPWTDGVNHNTAQFIDSTFARYYTVRKNSSNEIRWYASGKNISRANCYSTGWMHLAVTWSEGDDQVKAYYNGQQVGTTQTGLSAWGAMLLGSTGAVLGAALTTPSNPFSGNVCHVFLSDRVATPTEISTLYNLLFNPLNLSVIGDSISSPTNGWFAQTCENYNGGHCRQLNHAVTGHSIMTDLATDVAAAASDDADIIVIEMGINDSEGGDMGALQAEVEENIATLKSSNPRATIYYFNLLPVWTDSTGSTEIDKHLTRAAIAAACSSAGITCWDTYTTPWRSAAQTTDGIHPTAAGHSAILSQVLARLP